MTKDGNLVSATHPTKAAVIKNNIPLSILYLIQAQGSDSPTNGRIQISNFTDYTTFDSIYGNQYVAQQNLQEHVYNSEKYLYFWKIKFKELHRSLEAAHYTAQNSKI